MRDIKTEIIDTEKQISDLVDWLIFRYASRVLVESTMYIDLEGVDLCREGSLSILTLLINIGSPSMRNENIPKVFFDIRNDADALYAHFGVALQGVEDIQLMESATRVTTSSRKYLNGLAKCIEQSGLDSHDPTSWNLAKEKGARLFKPEFGGSYKIFEQRPICDDIISYCVGDVQYLPNLRSKFRSGTVRWQVLVRIETKRRVETSHKPEYQPHGPDRTLAPWSEDQNKTLDDEWNYVPPPPISLDRNFHWSYNYDCENERNYSDNSD
ncbi:uncharacterized protein EAE97_003568 [Botrytis byssoidea]|uniref:3'-5' exonuclease domain-containing protein n=1 Tax=Botrytis byssoidea TaxID=139641 RepID=A0A9P5INA5_9HELO|nr:uncharacterized protein EAE97_003568 [Botrytis byssoidea]KAF7948157.1 hypothetical protein EAE97_003568 [Botrytis byssoidea]